MNTFVSVQRRVALQAQARPDAVALVYGDQTVTYAELDRRANQLARRLQRAGAAKDKLIAIGMDRSIEMIVGLLGILRSGAAYLPIDLEYPKERLDFTISDAQPVAMLTTRASAAAMPASEAPVFFVDDETLAQEDGSDLGLPCDPTALAYVIYTSGSTGRPKGCLVTHLNVTRLFDETAPWYRFGPDDVWPLFHSHAFDVSVWEIWNSLSTGGRLVVVPYLTTRSPEVFLDLLVREKVTVLNQTPSAFRPLIDVDRRSGLPADALKLRVVIFAGEPLSFEMLRPWFERHGDTLPTMVNMYGITETTVHVSYRPVSWQDLELRRGSMIGVPIPDLKMLLLDAEQKPVADGETGEIVVTGPGVTNGYLRRPDLSAQRFIDWTDPATGKTERAYRSGDLGKRHPDGDIECLGRMDHQVKIRGFRIETGEIENLLLRHEGVRECAVLARTDSPDGEARLVAYVVPAGAHVPASVLRSHLAKDLPQFMLPSAIVELAALPITENGKLDRRALPAPPSERPELAVAYVEASTALERRVCQAFTEALGIDRSGLDDNFFELGGSSLLVARVLASLDGAGVRTLGVTDFFANPTPRALVALLQAPATSAITAAPIAAPTHNGLEPVAIIGMAGRFPGAVDVEQFWNNLCEGRESITFFDDSTLDAGVAAALRNDPDYVRARGVMSDTELFDAAFFGINPKEAQTMDPQQRIFLELCWECVERAGYAPDSCPGPVGVFAGMYSSTYYQRHVVTRPDLIEQIGEFQVMLGNDKDYVATRVAHKLNLTGPAISVHTACSTSLVAVAQAFAALRNGDCDMALAGAAAVTCPPRAGYLHEEGAMLSPDGHTRSFDAQAGGTVFSDGAAVVLLKRLSSALADGDKIHAVIRGVAINNDGGVKASFTAPSIDGQARVVSAALRSAGVEARSISYVETHGTATPMGDPIEVAALAKAYAAQTADTGFCAIGSVKSNIGHLVAAAGATGLIKTALALRDERIPASLHYTAPNPSIDFGKTPFVVNASLKAWPRDAATPRRAGVSSFGVGGTNAHVIVEEPPLTEPSQAASGPQVLKISARTPAALATAMTRLADHLEANPQVSIGDVAYTLDVGRKAFAQRAVVVAASAEEAVKALRGDDVASKAVGATSPWQPQPVFMFPGQGAQYAGMGRALYAEEPVFREALDEVMQALDGLLPFDLRTLMFSDDEAALKPTQITQPATFAIEYALARQLQSIGIAPVALIGHSIGEFAAAVLAGVMSLADAARLVAQRGALMQALPAGTMLSVRLSATELAKRLPAELSIAADNGPTACVASGPSEAIEAFRQSLEASGVAAKTLQTSHAFHSSMMQPAVAPFEALVRKVQLSAPRLPIYSTATGRLLSDAEATDPSYWALHLRDTVRFSPALVEAFEQVDHALFIEIGPRGTLSTLARQHATRQRSLSTLSTLADSPATECASWRLTAGRLWTLGLEPQLAKLDDRTRKLRVELPTYPFERKRFWIDIDASQAAASIAAPVTAVATTAIAAIAAPLESTEPTTMSTAQAAAAPTANRLPQLVARLRDVFEEISGLDLADAPSNAAFVELGLDSLTLTQVALQVKKQFKTGLTFRQLMESYRSFDALASYLDQTLPADPVAAVAPPVALQAAPAPVMATVAAMPIAAVAAAGTPVFAPVQPIAVPANGSLVQQVIAQQMQLMQQQLALLSAAPATTAAVGAMPVAQPAVTTQAAPTATTATTATTTQTTTDEAPLAAPTYDVKKAFGAIARIHTQSKEPTERQKARLAAFIRRYTDRTAKSKTFTQEHRPHMADPRVVNGFRPATKEITYQVVVERSKGSRVWDIDGNEYVDVGSGFGMNLFGWQPDFILDAVRKQLDLGFEIGPQHPLAADICESVCAITGHDRAGLCNTGSEAVMAAIRIARTATGRSTIVTFNGSYHGTFDEVLVRAGKNAKGMSAAPGVMQGMFGDIRVLDYGTPEALEFIRANADDIAAVLVEPVQSRRPDFQPKEFLREVRAITEKSETCLIFDEVITGFRSHIGGAQAIFGIKADLACYGKVIGGGMPVGVVAGKRAFMDALDGGAWQYGDDSVPTVGVTYFAGTFVRHPLALAAAKASLDFLKADNNALQTTLNLHTAAMADELTAFCREVGAPVEIRYFSSLWRVSWLEDHPLQDLLFAMMRSRGVHILDNFPCYMTMAHTQADIATIKSAFKESIAEMQEAELLPGRAPSKLVFDPSHPPAPDARLGRDKDGQPAWFVPDPKANGKFTKYQA